MRLKDVKLLKELMAKVEREAREYCEKEHLVYAGLTVDNDGFLAVSYAEEESCSLQEFPLNVLQDEPIAIFEDSAI